MEIEKDIDKILSSLSQSQQSITNTSEYFLNQADISKENEKYLAKKWHEHFNKNIQEKNEFLLTCLIYVANDFL